MADFMRMLVGLALLPACWAAARGLWRCVAAAGGGDGALCAESLSLLGGVASFIVCWVAMPRMTKTYVLGHELTHALWGLLFGAVPSRLRVGRSGGSVNLTKTNMLITLAPYFFPFYTFVVLTTALVANVFVRPLPWLPAWMFMIGFTWAFHVFFTLETLSERQPDVTAYGRVFSWTFIFMANVAVVAVFLACATPLGFARAWSFFADSTAGAYRAVWSAAATLAARDRQI